MVNTFLYFIKEFHLQNLLYYYISLGFIIYFIFFSVKVYNFLYKHYTVYIIKFDMYNNQKTSILSFIEF